MSEACGSCGRDPALGMAEIDGVRYCHWEWARGATCYTAAQRLASTEARRAAGEPPSVRDLLGILATRPDDRPCVSCGSGGTVTCTAGLHVYCDLHDGRGYPEDCDDCREGLPATPPLPDEVLAALTRTEGPTA